MKIIEWIDCKIGRWNKKPNDHKEQLSDAELIQKKKEFQARKQAINEFINLKGNYNQRNLCSVALDVLGDIETAITIELQRFDKYDLTNPCMTYDEHRNAIVDKYTAQISELTVYADDDVWMNAVDIPIEVLVYYATREPYLQKLLNKYDDVEYQRYMGMFKDDVVIFLSDLGFKSMFD